MANARASAVPNQLTAAKRRLFGGCCLIGSELQLPILLALLSNIGPLLLAGCSRGLESEVNGIVTLDGKAIGPGGVIFASTDDQRNPAIGSIQSDGSYSLNTSRTRGLLPGKYRVSLYVHEMPPGAKPTDRQETTQSKIPIKYEGLETSGLEFEVQSGRNTINLELRSQ